ncbi:bacterioferritin [Robiginitomaculum antarcticum]|uniref:bacterioferritin n=1 Tax=Robiginitomaculum antarcticum TaxID=437507 RepID=UPI00036E3000|nr:bacterioferritin [Robiginitomaculum antarcticum]
MRDNPKTIEFLNTALKNELTAINQYFLHSRILKDWGVSKLAKKEYEESIDEMNHADWIIERILFLNGLPNLQDLGKLYIGETVEEIIACDLKIENIAIPLLRDAVEHCETARDYVTRDLFAKILTSEEGHLDWLETQQDQIRLVGIQNYIQSQSEPNAE